MVLNAQRRAEAFYASQGYEPEGETFMEADIEHVRMTKRAVSPRTSPPEVRIDQLTGLRTILAAGPGRPPDRVHAEPRKEGAEESCPFCEGREKKTPLEVWADRPGGEPNTPGWRVRAVPNLYPAVGMPRGRRAVRGDPPAGDAAMRDPLRASARFGRARPLHRLGRRRRPRGDRLDAAPRDSRWAPSTTPSSPRPSRAGASG